MLGLSDSLWRSGGCLRLLQAPVQGVEGAGGSYPVCALCVALAAGKTLKFGGEGRQ